MTPTPVGKNPPPPTMSFVGIYSAADAARYINAADDVENTIRVTSSGLIRWIRMGLASYDLVHAHGKDMTLTFEDLISMRAISALRGAGVRWQEIKEAARILRQNTGMERPLASECLWTGQGRVYKELSTRIIIPEHRVTFDDDSGKALYWTPVKRVRLHPKIQFGAPCIENTRIPTDSLYAAVLGGDSWEFIAKSYNTSIENLEAALDWESRVTSIKSVETAFDWESRSMRMESRRI